MAEDSGPEPEERELAERFRRGEDQAVRQVYRRYQRAVSHLVAGGVPGVADAEDVMQATFVAAWLGRDTFDPQRGSLLGWVLGIARRQIVDRHRSRLREQRIAETVRAHPAPVRLGDPDVTLDRLLVADALARLPAQQRRVLELAFFDDLSHRQVADLTGLPLGTVKSQIRRGMASLKREWTVEGTQPVPAAATISSTASAKVARVRVPAGRSSPQPGPAAASSSP
jgi:RNA polymerase sigma factor (sigma-70 family)